MKKFVVTTTINTKTPAIEKLESLADWTLIVVGDLKTPKDYKVNGIYLSPDDQTKLDSDLSDAIGWNCVQRRSFGYLLAYSLGADIVATIDDDNIPLDNWGTTLHLGKETAVTKYITNDLAFDPIGATNYKHLWHRGFPLELISSRDYSTRESAVVIPDVQADFWNGDPDIDAICRLEHRPDCTFDHAVFPFTSNRFAPFNSQNTFLTRKVLKDYFMFPNLGRMDDIWAGYYLQALGATVIFNSPTVFQERNPHNLITDMTKEYLGYENNLSLVRDLSASPDKLKKYMPGASWHAFELYQKHFI